jgi:hypothetical protein
MTRVRKIFLDLTSPWASKIKIHLPNKTKILAQQIFLLAPKNTVVYKPNCAAVNKDTPCI